jgi:hypothetical protein
MPNPRGTKRRTFNKELRNPVGFGLEPSNTASVRVWPCMRMLKLKSKGNSVKHAIPRTEPIKIRLDQGYGREFENGADFTGWMRYIPDLSITFPFFVPSDES